MEAVRPKFFCRAGSQVFFKDDIGKGQNATFDFRSEDVTEAPQGLPLERRILAMFDQQMALFGDYLTVPCASLCRSRQWLI